MKTRGFTSLAELKNDPATGGLPAYEAQAKRFSSEQEIVKAAVIWADARSKAITSEGFWDDLAKAEADLAAKVRAHKAALS